MTFAFSGVKGLFALSLSHLSGTKGLHVILTFALVFFSSPYGHHMWLTWSLIPFKVQHHKPGELLMLLSHTLCDTKIRYEGVLTKGS